MIATRDESPKPKTNTPMTVQEALGVSKDMPELMAIKRFELKPKAHKYSFLLPLPRVPSVFNRPETIIGYDKRMYNYEHILNHHIHCREIDKVATERRLTITETSFKT